MAELNQVKVAELLENLGAALDKTAAERDEALKKLAVYEAKDKGMKLAQLIHSKGLEDGTLAEIAERCTKLAQEDPGRYATKLAAVEMIGENNRLQMEGESPSKTNAGTELDTWVLDR